MLITNIQVFPYKTRFVKHAYAGSIQSSQNYISINDINFLIGSLHFCNVSLSYTLCKISLLRGIIKSLQRLPRKTELWEGLWVCHILQSWGHFFLGSWL